MTGVKFNSIHSILVRFLHITQFTVCAAKNLTVFVAYSPRCLEWSSMVAAVSRALRELSEPCLGWTREPRRQPKSLGARRQYSQATANNVLPVMTGSPAFLTRPPPVDYEPGSEIGVGWKIGVTWSRKRGFKMAATEVEYLLSKSSFWLSLWHDISISWHGDKEFSPWARPPNFGYRYHLGWIILIVILG